jgi:hypothetical protein
MSRFGLLNSDVNWAEEVANLFLLLMKALVEQEFAYVLRGATYYASSSFRSTCVTSIDYPAPSFALSL